MACRSWIERSALIGTLVTTLSFASFARAEPQVEADDDLRRGVALRREGKDAEALAAFQHALERSPSARARAQVALAEQALALWLAAERDLTLALAEKDDPWIKLNREVLERAARIVEAKLAYVVVSSNVDAPEVLVNGASATSGSGADSRARRRVVAGQVTIEVRAPGYEAAQKTIQVAPETTANVALQLRPAPPPGAASAPRDGGAVTTEPRVSDTSNGTQRTVGFILTGAGIAGLGLGVGFGVRAMGAKSDRDADCASGCTQLGVDADRAGRDAALVSTIATVAGLAATGVGIWLVLRTPAPKSSVAMRWTSGFVSVSGTF